MDRRTPDPRDARAPLSRDPATAVRDRPRDQDRPRETGTRAEHRREPGRDDRPLRQREEEALADTAVFRTVAYRDLVDAHYGGHHYAAKRSLEDMAARGLIEIAAARGRRGGRFLVVTATDRGRRAADDLLGGALRTWSGRAKEREAAHDCGVYRAARAEIARLEASGCQIHRVRLEGELKAEIYRPAERIRQAQGKAAADRARQAAAKAHGVPVAESGKVQLPDLQIEYSEAGSLQISRCNVEVVSDSYRASQVKAKAEAGFSLAGMGAAAGRHVASASTARRLAVAGGGGGGGTGRGSGADASKELPGVGIFEL